VPHALRVRRLPLAKSLEDAFAQNIGIALASLGKFDDALGDDLVSTIAPVRKPKGRTNHFEPRVPGRAKSIATIICVAPKELTKN
jgi:hypothetical protein